MYGQVITVSYLQMFAVPVVSTGRVMEVPVEPANVSMLKWKAQQAPSYKNSKLWNRGSFMFEVITSFLPCAPSHQKHRIRHKGKSGPLFRNVASFISVEFAGLTSVKRQFYMNNQRDCLCGYSILPCSSQFVLIPVLPGCELNPFWPYSLHHYSLIIQCVWEVDFSLTVRL